MVARNTSLEKANEIDREREKREEKVSLILVNYSEFVEYPKQE